MKEKRYVRRLYTSEGERLSGTPWNEYPRPQMRRGEWLCLNGEWDLETENAKGKILVPFCPESLLSGWTGKIQVGEKLRYERTFCVPDGWRGKRILLRFGAVSRACEVFVNGSSACRHDDAYLPFSADITDLLTDGENVLSVCAVNDLSPAYPYGKQKKDRGGMWYTPVSGIWQTVWLEPVPEKYIKEIKISCDMRGAFVMLDGVTDGKISCGGREYDVKDGAARIEPADPKLWSPESPYLYEFTVRSGDDEVRSYFALRELSEKEVGGVSRLCLNGEPYFFNGLLDQGYFSDGIYTPATPTAFEDDIKYLKSLGFNTLRKHIKIEPERFYYDCDRLGMIVFQDMVNSGKYSFWHDTIMPTLGVKNVDDRQLNADEATRKNFILSTEETVKTLFDHPCVCLWTIFNEGWGQFCADEMYDKIKSLDGSRFIDSTSGWFCQNKSDVDSRHIYFGRLNFKKPSGKPRFLSEFGGYVFKVADHSFNVKKTYGYKIFKTREAFVNALRSVYLDEIVPLVKDGLCGAILTQVSDVEDETNGLLTYDRKVKKITPDEFADVSRAINEALRGD
ncbi:MAG: glycoside hydrolase family 2 [Clostridia bacterium]|nr:glycoside hydrolase family 2 [Clostridia bacterium]